ncbi:MAG: DNA cytosine methyltransferase [Clostridiales Family XIII bacterium]|jgi:DNA (cytosine-5)-methyltransferase 1|nr:DNA cytosine methyltransferase [Clostridiales Family XIII bacterium]
MAVRIVDLFAGCGGLTLGFQNAGFDIVGAFEYWDAAASCYAHNFDHAVFQDDLSDAGNAIGKIKSLDADIIIGGPPCQDFSHAGKRVEASRAGLTGSFAEIVSGIHPKYFVMENVDRALKSNAYSFARQALKDAGYGLTEIVLDASYCGVPQRRKRFFCIGSLNQSDGFLLEYFAKSKSAKEMTLRDYFGNTLDVEYYYRHPRNYCRRAIFSIDEPAPTVRGVNRPIPQGYPGHPNDACKISQCERPLTTLERALVQTFPPDFKWESSKTNMEQMIGNAVPVKLAEFVARALLYHINECEGVAQSNTTLTIDYKDFSEWLNSAQALSDRTKRDTMSRLKRADAICAITQIPDDYYFFHLDQTPDFRSIAPTVRSQIKRAVSLFSEYCTSQLFMQEAV